MRFTEVRSPTTRADPSTRCRPGRALVLRTSIVATAPVDEPIFGFVIWLGGDPRLLDQHLPARDGHRPLRARRAACSSTSGSPPPWPTAATGDGGRPSTSWTGACYDWVNHAGSLHGDWRPLRRRHGRPGRGVRDEPRGRGRLRVPRAGGTVVTATPDAAPRRRAHPHLEPGGRARPVPRELRLQRLSEHHVIVDRQRLGGREAPRPSSATTPG